MFKSYKFVGIHGHVNDLCFDYEVVDDNFIDHDYVKVSGVGVGGAVEIASAVITAYEKNGLDVCSNLLVALRWHSQEHDYELSDGLVSIKKYCEYFKKYEAEFDKLLLN